MVVAILCPGCEAPLRVELDNADYASGECEHCGEPIEIVDGEVYGAADDEDLRPW